MTTFLRVLPAILGAAVVFAQTPPRVEFEVASVKPSAQQAMTQQVQAGVQIDGAQVHCRYLSIKDYIRFAYNVKDHQISGPDFMAGARFDISAKIPAGTGRDQVREMMKSLLEDRFQMKLHRETKEFPVYGLVVAKGGLKMKESPETDAAEAARAPVNVVATGGPGGTSIDLGRGSAYTFGNNKFIATKLDMVNLADTLARFADKPVVDMTELKGRYDFTLEFTPEDYRAMLIRSALAAGVSLPPEALRALDASGDSLFAALQTVGLKLENRRAPLEMLVVDQVSKTATEN